MQRISGAWKGAPTGWGRRGYWASGISVLLALAVVAVAAIVLSSGGDDNIAPSVATMPTTDNPDAAYRTRLSPLFRQASVEARALVTLGESRSRNLFAIRSGQGRMEERLGAIDRVLVAAAPPPQLDEAIAAYHSGAGTVRRAMGEAEAAFLRLDWDRVARATDLLVRGADLLDRAFALLGATSDASPAAVVGRPTIVAWPQLAPDVL